MRKSTSFMFFIASAAVICIALSLHALHRGSEAHANRAYDSQLVKELELTDLCIFTEARYTRHPAMADNHSAFQDHPSALEHFPSGSLAMPRRILEAQ